MSPAKSPSRHCTQEAIQSQQARICLDGILSSDEFRRSARICRFLKYLVEGAAAGTKDYFKEYAIGLEVFDRKPDFDPRLDPIVRVEARRLRAKLGRYYAREGARDPIRISLQERGYAVCFAPVDELSSVSTADSHIDGERQISILMAGFECLDRSDASMLFSRGLTDEISHALVSIGGVDLATDWSRPDGSETALRWLHFGLARRPDFVLFGSVRSIRKKFRVVVQLSDLCSGYVKWSQIYEVEKQPAVTAQSGIAIRLGAEIRELLFRTGGSKENGRPTSRPGAWALYHQGRRYLDRRTSEGIRRSIDCFQEAIEFDGHFALAHAGLADSYSLGTRYDVLPPGEFWSKARCAALEALRIDDSLAEAYTALGFVDLHKGRDFSAAEENFKTAIRLSPRYAPAHRWYAWCLLSKGNASAAVEYLQAALLLDPASLNATADFALALYFARRYRASAAECWRTLKIAPGFCRTHHVLGLNLLQLRDYEQALQHFKLGSGSHPSSRSLAAEARVFAAMGQHEQVKRVGDRMGAGKLPAIRAIDLAVFHSAMGDLDASLRCLETASQNDDGELIWLPIDPLYDPMRKDPRFALLLRSFGLRTNLTASRRGTKYEGESLTQ